MRISVVHSFYKTAVPSGENFTVEMQVNALRAAGHTVQLVAIYTDELAKNPFYPIKAAVNAATGTGRSPQQELLSFDPDVVHIHNFFPNYSTRWLRDWNGPIVATLHNFRPVCANGILFRDGHQCMLCPQKGNHNAVVHACYKDSRLATLPVAYGSRHGAAGNPVISRSDRLVVLSPRARELYESFGVARDKLVVVPNFVADLPHTKSAKHEGAGWFCAGRLTPEKGILDLLRAWPPNEPIIVAGSGPQEESIRSLAASKDNIKYVGQLSRYELLRLLPNTRGLILPSLCAENLPTIYLEALAAGLPVIARRGNSAADDVELWSENLTYTSERELHQALGSVRGAIEETSDAAREHFAKKYTEEAWTRSMLAVYQAVQDPMVNVP